MLVEKQAQVKTNNLEPDEKELHVWRAIWVARGNRPAVQARANPMRYLCIHDRAGYGWF